MNIHTSFPAAIPTQAALPIDAVVPHSAVIAHVFDRLNLRQRARLLGRLLSSVGPLAMVVVSGGAFAKYVVQARWTEMQVSIEDAASTTASQVYDLVRYVQQSNPAIIGQVMSALATDPTVIAALGASIAALAITQRSERGLTRKDSAI